MGKGDIQCPELLVAEVRLQNRVAEPRHQEVRPPGPDESDLGKVRNTVVNQSRQQGGIDLCFYVIRDTTLYQYLKHKYRKAI